MQNIQVSPGFNVNILEVMKQKESSMECKLCTVAMDETVAVKESLSFNVEKDPIQGFEDFGSHGRIQYVANHVIAFMVRGVVLQMERAFGAFSLQWPMTPPPSAVHPSSLGCWGALSLQWPMTPPLPPTPHLWAVEDPCPPSFLWRTEKTFSARLCLSPSVNMHWCDRRVSTPCYRHLPIRYIAVL